MGIESFNKNLKVAGVTVGLGLGVIGTTIGVSHGLKKDQPDAISLDNKKTLDKPYESFNLETKEELERLQEHYLRIYKDKHKDSQLADSVIQKHFQEFVETYGSKINIALSSDNTRAYHEGHTVSYIKGPVKDTAYFQKMNLPAGPLQSSNLDDFISEMAHEINNDQSFGRKVKEVEEGADERHAYSDPSRLEYQAHQITENIISDWLFNDPDVLEKASFKDMYNYIWAKYPLVDKKLEWLDYQSKLFDDHYQKIRSNTK
jgi:hypothetical protein